MLPRAHSLRGLPGWQKCLEKLTLRHAHSWRLCHTVVLTVAATPFKLSTDFQCKSRRRVVQHLTRHHWLWQSFELSSSESWQPKAFPAFCTAFSSAPQHNATAQTFRFGRTKGDQNETEPFSRISSYAPTSPQFFISILDGELFGLNWPEAGTQTAVTSKC